MPERMQLRSDAAAASRGTATGRPAVLERAAGGMQPHSGTVLALEQSRGGCDGRHTWRPDLIALCGKCDPRWTHESPPEVDGEGDVGNGSDGGGDGDDGDDDGDGYSGAAGGCDSGSGSGGNGSFGFVSRHCNKCSCCGFSGDIQILRLTNESHLCKHCLWENVFSPLQISRCRSFADPLSSYLKTSC